MFHSCTDNNLPTSSKGAFSPLAGLLLLSMLGVYCSSVVLQTQQVWPGFRQPRPGTRWFHDSGAPCLANLPAAGVWGPGWLIISISLFLSLSPSLPPAIGSLALDVGRPDPHQGVCTDIYLDGDRSSTRLKRKGKCRVGMQKCGWMKCQATGKLCGWLAVS